MTQPNAGTRMSCAHADCGCAVVIEKPCGCAEAGPYRCHCGAELVAG